jgi:UDP-N-acetylmuramyl tripeptide synthase
MDKVTTILNRGHAIAHAAKITTHNSIIALLSKRHENYLVVKEQVLHFNDLEEISHF